VTFGSLDAWPEWSRPDPEAVVTTAGVLGVALLLMLAEAALSRHHERRLFAEGAYEAPGDVYRAMRLVYPAGFVLIGAEGLFRGAPNTRWLVSGVCVFVAAKALKYAAIAALGYRWTFKVLVLPGRPLVTTGPYRYMRHPNYVAVIGEYIGVALMMRAPVTGALVTLAFGMLIARRVRVEMGALRAAAAPPGTAR
jgi:methyltransferase